MVKQESLTADIAVDEIADVPPVDLDDPQYYLNRELSWLEFARRVFDEVLDTNNPLLERVKFTSIVSSILDEFFMVRVAGLVEQRLAGTSRIGPDMMTATEQLAAIHPIVTALTKAQRDSWNDDLRPRLAEEGIKFETYADLTNAEIELLNDFFERQIYPVLTPQAIDAGRPFPHISSLSLNMLIIIEDERGEHVARLKIPPVVPRFVEVPSGPADEVASFAGTARYVLVEEVIERNLPLLFPGKTIRDVHMFRITRDADLEIRESISSSLLETIQEELDRQLFGFVVRLTIEPSMPVEWRNWLAMRLNVEAIDMFVMDRPLGFADLFEIYLIDRPELKDPPLNPRIPQVFRDSGSIFEAMKRHEIMLYHPYDSFNPVIDLISQASADPEVVAIKQTLYRIGSQSPVVDALLDARDDEKQVAVLVELKARGDEESNILWARELENAGVHVAYGLAGLKTHCKAILIVRREGNRLARYIHLGTGNYNPTTARLYTDLSFFTVDEDIASDVTEVFNQLTGYSSQREYRKLLVAPVNMKERIIELIRKEASYGEDGRLILKMNGITHPEVIVELYRASQAGAKIDIIARSICSVRPGVPGVSDNIRVRSLVGRFLEHPRIYYFRHGSPDENEQVYSGSADLMNRNLDSRVEILFPVEDPILKDFLINDILQFQLKDNTRARLMQPDGTWQRVKPGANDEIFDSQALPGPRPPDTRQFTVNIVRPG